MKSITMKNPNYSTKHPTLFAAAAVASGLLLFGSMGIGCGQHTTAGTTGAESPGQSAAVARVTAARPARKTLRLETSQPGRIEAFEETPVHSKLSAYVDEVLVDIGDPVKKGQPLVSLWVPEMLDDAAQKEALVAQAEAQVRQADAGVSVAKAAAASAEARRQQAEAGIDRAEGEYDRWQSEDARIRALVAKRSLTQKLADEARNQFRAAQATRAEALAGVKSAAAAFEEAQAGIQKAEADKMAAEASLRVAQADLARTRTLLEYAHVKSPFDGVITRRNVDTGHYVQPAGGSNPKPLMIVARNDEVRIFVDVPELEASLVDTGENGDPAVVHVQALGIREFAANVTRCGWSLDPSNRSLRVEIDIPSTGGLLRPGMYATATILLAERPDALVLPVSAVVREGHVTFCCCVAGGRIQRRPIELGLRSGDEVEVRSGLDASDVVVLSRAESLQPDQPVEIIEPAK